MIPEPNHRRSTKRLSAAREQRPAATGATPTTLRSLLRRHSSAHAHALASIAFSAGTGDRSDRMAMRPLQRTQRRRPGRAAAPLQPQIRSGSGSVHAYPTALHCTARHTHAARRSTLSVSAAAAAASRRTATGRHTAANQTSPARSHSASAISGRRISEQ